MKTPVDPGARRRLMPLWLWILLVLFALSALLAGALVGWLASLDPVPVNIIIDGSEVWSFDPSGLSAGHWATLAAALTLATVLGVVVLIVSIVMGLVVGLGLPFLLLLLAAAVLFSPLLLLGALAVALWRSVRAPATPASTGAAHAANIAG
jgi:hypothetical protein